MSLLRIDHVAGREAAPRASAWDRLVRTALLTSLALATIGWCVLLALALWRAFQWTVAQAL